MGGINGLWLGEDSVGVGLIDGRKVDGGMGRRHGITTWGLGWLGSVTLRPVEACVEGLGLGLAWAGDIEAGKGVGWRARSD